MEDIIIYIMFSSWNPNFLNCPECNLEIAFREFGTGYPLICPHCRNEFVIKHKYYWFYLLACASSALLVAYAKGWEGPLFVGGFVIIYSIALFAIGHLILPFLPQKLERRRSNIITLEIDSHK